MHLFLENKYQDWYNSLISNAKNRSIEGYTEKHHIIPKSMGGSNKKDNLVKLTAREHFIAHVLLTKFTESTNKAKMITALWRFCVGGNKNQKLVSSRYYEKLKIQFSEMKSAEMIGEKNHFYGKNHSAEARQKISEAGIGRKMSQETKQKLSDANKGKNLSVLTEDGLRRIKEYRSTQVFSEESLAKRSKSISSLVWINNGIKNSRVKPDVLDKYTNDGWVQGRLMNYITEEYRTNLSMAVTKDWQKRKGI
jgi:hypothetical protein